MQFFLPVTSSSSFFTSYFHIHNLPFAIVIREDLNKKHKIMGKNFDKSTYKQKKMLTLLKNTDICKNQQNCIQEISLRHVKLSFDLPVAHLTACQVISQSKGKAKQSHC